MAFVRPGDLMFVTRMGSGLLVGALMACSSAPVAKDTSGNPEVRNEKEADANLGKTVRVIGEAENAKLSAIVATDDDWFVYLIDIREWPDAVEGKTVEATGVLGKRDAMVPAATGEISAGTDKPIFVLRESSYLVLDD